MAYYFSPFRKEYGAAVAAFVASCAFCDGATYERQAVRDVSGEAVQNEHAVWVVNFFPRFEGHTMIVPRRHILRLEEERPEETIARQHLTCYAMDRLKALYPNAGIEIFLQTGSGSASSIPHLHWHVVPAQETDPLRGFEKIGQFYTTEKNEEKIILFPQKIEFAREDLIHALAPIVTSHPYSP